MADGDTQSRFMTAARVIVADPPWPSPNTSPRWGIKQASHHQYKLMNMEDIKNYLMPPMDDYCVLFLWRLASMQQQALEVCKSWGFRPYGEMVWRKKTSGGKDWFGMGLLIRSSHETCLVGVKKMPMPLNKNVRSVFDAPYTGRHSGKPDEFYNIVERLSPGPYVELFARKQRPGWTCIGDEL